MKEKRGSLIVIGSGIKAGAHLTQEAKGYITCADRVLHIVADPITQEIIEDLNQRSESLTIFYEHGKSRSESYQQMIDKIVDTVMAGNRTCVVFYGHPGVFAFPGHEAIRILRSREYVAKMAPGISAEDCLFSDLGVDPARYGCQSFEATDFLLNQRIYDPRSLLVLWQIGVLGDGTFQKQGYDNSKIPSLLNYLFEVYSEEHEAVIYEASQYVVCEPRIEYVKLKNLKDAFLTPISTMVLFPARETTSTSAKFQELGLKKEHFVES